MSWAERLGSKFHFVDEIIEITDQARRAQSITEATRSKDSLLKRNITTRMG